MSKQDVRCRAILDGLRRRAKVVEWPFEGQGEAYDRARARAEVAMLLKVANEKLPDGLYKSKALGVDIEIEITTLFSEDELLPVRWRRPSRWHRLLEAGRWSGAPWGLVR